jgi:hypothetical protein
VLAVTALLVAAGPASARPQVEPTAANSSPAPAAGGSTAGGSPRAPTEPPLASSSTGGTGGESGKAGGGAGSDASASTPSSSGDPLVSNGLGSPLCTAGTAPIELSSSAERDCELSGFQASEAPTSNYAFDVHIETGVLGLSSDMVASAVQNLLVTPVWMGLVWVVQALVVALEWAFTIDLLEGGAMSGVADGLRTAQATFTQPWLLVVLAIAAVLAAYHGLVRRRVAETLGQALLTLIMIAVGLWVIADPLGTVGALARWTNQASLGALGAVSQGTPDHAQITLSEGMGEVFATGVGAPWCYMEFGNVHWCEDPHELDPRLHVEAQGLAEVDQHSSACYLKTGSLGGCVQPGSEQARLLDQSARLLREAHTNGELFLALPANQPQRNSITESGSLLHVLCDSEDATNCRGPTAQQAEFRTEDGTWPRAEGLLLILIGALGMILLLGFIAVRLLSAAIMSLFYLLLAPAAVLAPALGDGGRAAFRGWASRLLGAITAKLLYSVMLGVVLLMMRIVLSLHFGWWVQWLLASVLWWGAFRHRDALWSDTFRHHQQILNLAGAGRGGGGGGRSRIGGMRLASMVMGGRETARLAGWAKGKIARPGPEAKLRQTRAKMKIGGEQAKAKSAEQVARVLQHEHRDASKRVARAPETRSRIARARTQLRDVVGARETARAGGDTRRAIELDARAKRIESETAAEQRKLSAARRLTAGGERMWGVGDHIKAEAHQRGARWLDGQAALPDNAAANREGRRRNYPALAGLVGHERGEYERMSPGAQRQVRLDIDRELRLRRELNKAAGGEPEVEQPQLRGGERRRATEHFDRDLKQRLSADGQGLAPSLRESSPIDRWREEGRRAEQRPERTAQDRAGESQVTRDARARDAARRRQFGRPKEQG